MSSGRRTAGKMVLTIIIPESMTTIMANAFSLCNGMKRITLPASLSDRCPGSAKGPLLQLREHAEGASMRHMVMASTRMGGRVYFALVCLVMESGYFSFIQLM